MDEFPQPKPLNVSKPPVKTWSELLSDNASTLNCSNSSNNNSNGNSANKPSLMSGSGSNSTCTSRPGSTLNFEHEFEAALRLTESFEEDSIGCPDAEFLYRPLRMKMIANRPIINPGNRCYMIAVLQALLHTRLFTNYVQKYFFRLELLPAVLETEKFPLLAALRNFYSHFQVAKVTTGPVPHEPIDDIFIALQSKRGSFSGAGFAEQEDAEEFLTALLDSLGEEFIAIQSQKLLNFCQPFSTTSIEKNQINNKNNNNPYNNSNNHNNNNYDGNNDEWLQVGPKQRIITTRSTPITSNPIHSLFSGSFESLYRAPGARPSITFEPFTVLPLPLVVDFNHPLDSVAGALDHLLRREYLDRKCTKQLAFASLPPVLIIQLKRFIYRCENGKKSSSSPFQMHKLTKSLKIPLQLHLHQNQTQNQNFNNNNTPAYNLYALVNHHGNSPNTGHYTATIKLDSTDDDENNNNNNNNNNSSNNNNNNNNSNNNNNNNNNNSWFNFDDEASLEKVNNITSILNQNTSAYLLFYERAKK